MKYCYECGERLTERELENEGIVQYCEKCGEYRFPIFSTAVSMIVENPDKTKILLIQQYGRKNNILVAGYVNKGENAESAVMREVMEETGLEIKTKGLIWHIEEVSERGQRFVNFFKARVTGGELGLGDDPELPANGQVLSEVRFMSREEVAQLEHVYPEFLRTELWEHLEQGTIDYDAFRMRDE